MHKKAVITIILLVLLTHHHPYTVRTGVSPRVDGKIFVSVASYRDPQLLPTVSDMLSKAVHPDRLVLGVCIQDEDDTTSAVAHKLRHLCATHACALRLVTMSYRQAKGPTWARYLIQREWQGEQYYLQVDSHMRFVKGWDEHAIACLSRCRGGDSTRHCLTNYVARYCVRTGRVESECPLRGPLFVEKIDPIDMFFRLRSLPLKSAKSPIPSSAWAACFSFSSSHLIVDAPYDPYTPFLFFGEETDIAARLFTRGWKFFAPDVPLCFSNFDRTYRHTIWENPRHRDLEPASRKRVQIRLGLLPPPNEHTRSLYTLGTLYTYKDFVDFAMAKRDLYICLNFETYIN